jgi:hypothetical protein
MAAAADTDRPAEAAPVAGKPVAATPELLVRAGQVTAPCLFDDVACAMDLKRAEALWATCACGPERGVA